MSATLHWLHPLSTPRFQVHGGMEFRWYPYQFPQTLTVIFNYDILVAHGTRYDVMGSGAYSRSRPRAVVPAVGSDQAGVAVTLREVDTLMQAHAEQSVSLNEGQAVSPTHSDSSDDELPLQDLARRRRTRAVGSTQSGSSDDELPLQDVARRRRARRSTTYQ